MARRKGMEKNMDDFSKELEQLGKRIEKKVEGKDWDDWFHNTFGIVGPLLSSIISIVGFAIGIRVMAIVNSGMGSSILQSLHDFLLENMGIFFMVFLFFSYSSYLSRSSNRTFRLIKPVFSAIGFVVALWIALSIFLAINVHMKIEVLGDIAGALMAGLMWIFWIALMAGYIYLLVGDSHPQEKTGRVIVSKPRSRNATKRLYRSGNDKILGGVCGGIADYLQVDPVVIRLLWVVGTLVSMGTGVLAYIIAWIIIPRNPEHRWE